MTLDKKFGILLKYLKKNNLQYCIVIDTDLFTISISKDWNEIANFNSQETEEVAMNEVLDESIAFLKRIYK